METIQGVVNQKGHVVKFISNSSFSKFSNDDKDFIKNLPCPLSSLQNLVQNSSMSSSERRLYVHNIDQLECGLLDDRATQIFVKILKIVITHLSRII